ncbi:MAG: TerB family tellurite resistance protein [Sandaracinaceae bacterium]|nr:TerB family tellurite resistance protein [Sandaracinaceae bacterium]
MSAKQLGGAARRAIFEALVAMAWADARLEREEILAIQAAGRVLSLPDDALDALDEGAPPVSQIANASLDARERELVYLCAAWLASVDGRDDPGEDGLLSELRAALGIDPARATSLRDDARLLHATVPSSMPWWQELERLIASAAAL